MVERLITVESEGKKAMRATCKDAINAMNINCDDCPILLAKMTFNIFSHYVSMEKVRNRECIYLPPSIEVPVVY